MIYSTSPAQDAIKPEEGFNLSNFLVSEKSTLPSSLPHSFSPWQHGGYVASPLGMKLCGSLHPAPAQVSGHSLSHINTSHSDVEMETRVLEVLDSFK